MLERLTSAALPQPYGTFKTTQTTKPARQAVLGGTVNPLNLSAQRHLANRQSLIQPKDRLLVRTTPAPLKTQAVLNPFKAARNPVSEKEFDQLLKDLAPVAPGLKQMNPAEKKALFKRWVASTNQLLLDVTQLRKSGNTVELITYREDGKIDMESRLPIVAGANQKLVQASGSTYLPGANQHRPITSFDDLMGCIGSMVVLSLLFGPQMIIGGPLSVKLENMGASAKNQLKDARFYLQALPKTQSDFKADFETLDFSSAEKKKLSPGATAYGKNVARNDSLRSHVDQVFEAMKRVAGTIKPHHQDQSAESPLKIGLLSVDRLSGQKTLKDVSTLFSAEGGQ
ncbi:hypothetical protein [Vampirovibrio sp.]|uniref:hypothetical protein n=1 Tax=Vampirovibrio sp. TaxID=2717857 RepID=UPI003593859C